MEKKNDELIEKTDKPKKPKGKPRGGNSPVIGNNGLNLEAGDNAKFLGVGLQLLNMPEINMKDAEQVAQRLNDFFALYAMNDMKPTVAGFALSLNGMNRQMVWAIVNDQPTGSTGYKAALPPEVTDTIKKAYKLMENLWESYMNSGKINPVSGIFLGKNQFGYQDKQEHIITPNTQNESDYDPDDIRRRYLPANATIESDS